MRLDGATFVILINSIQDKNGGGEFRGAGRHNAQLSQITRKYNGKNSKSFKSVHGSPNYYSVGKNLAHFGG